MLVSYRNQYPIELPYRIRLSSGATRTDPSTFTDEEILDAGYVKVDPPPEIAEDELLSWTDGNWVIEQVVKNSDLKWREIRHMREAEINAAEWRISRYNSERRLEIPTTDNIADLDQYVQALRDITKQSDPFNVEWPARPWLSKL